MADRINNHRPPPPQRTASEELRENIAGAVVELFPRVGQFAVAVQEVAETVGEVRRRATRDRRNFEQNGVTIQDINFRANPGQGSASATYQGVNGNRASVSYGDEGYTGSVSRTSQHRHYTERNSAQIQTGPQDSFNISSNRTYPRRPDNFSYISAAGTAGNNNASFTVSVEDRLRRGGALNTEVNYDGAIANDELRESLAASVQTQHFTGGFETARTRRMEGYAYATNLQGEAAEPGYLYEYLGNDQERRVRANEFR